MDWQPINLGDYIHIKHGYAFKSKFYSNSGNHILLTPGNCYETGGLKLKGEKEKYYIGDIPDEFLLKEGDLLVVMTDLINSAPILGGGFIIPENDKFLHNQRLGLVDIKEPTKLDHKFLYYLLNDHPYRAQVRGSASGATVRHTAPERIYKCRVKVPRKIGTQKKIASILSAYDDLIENNLRRIALLEESARLLYKEWFVRLRFPGYEHTKIKDGVPEGWDKVPVSKAIHINPKTKVEKDTEKTYVPMASLSVTQMTVSDLGKRTSVSGSKFINGDTLFPRITPCLENGKTAFVQFLKDGETGIGSTEFIVLRANLVTHEFVYCLARTYDFRENAIKSMVGSSGRQRVQEECFDDYFINVPPGHILNTFTELVRPCFAQIKNLTMQIDLLKSALNLLLPRLMNGAIAV